jgi:DNA repair exonuclease SbcCD nuclease subunit
VLSIVDPENWQTELPEDRVNIALYHGSVVGSVTDSGWMMTHGDISLDELEKYDYAMLGDIHKTDQKVDNDGRARYPGSLVQQNHGESNDKGYLIWDIEDKNTGIHAMFRLLTRSRLLLSNLLARDECQRIFLFRMVLVFGSLAITIFR